MSNFWWILGAIAHELELPQCVRAWVDYRLWQVSLPLAYTRTSDKYIRAVRIYGRF